MKAKFIKGDIVEVINNYNGSCFERHVLDVDGIGQRFRISFCFLDTDQRFIYKVEGLQHVYFRSSNIILYKRPIKNWIKLIFSK